ncbi:glycosyl transferase [Halovibrio variabilis]|uniref:Glycosyl transferase n=1 Tax=Halovibrio variabilis TaxID=31910 RepID=A0A511UVW7_9GAMM|nr:glycosyltransferase family 4 protein [Halovibrio variabilis]GEN29593.1 glycosyl transferase [Halovibrio variabilis]
MIDILIIAGNARSLIANRGDLIQDIKSRGWSVAAAVPSADYLSEVENLGIPIYHFAMGRTGMNPLHDMKTLLSLRQLIKTCKPAAVFGYNIKPVIYGSLAAKSAGVPRIYSMITGLGHAFTADKKQKKHVRMIASFLYRSALLFNKKVFFQNPDDIQEFLDRGILKNATKVVRVYGSGVNREQYPPVALPDGKVTFLYIGRLLREKGITEFCEAATQVKADYPQAQFVAVGGHDPTLPHACSNSDLERWKSAGDVEFVGNVSDVRPWIEQGTVFVFPSYYREGTPRCVLEAMSMGRPIITTDSPGCRETVLRGENGILVPPRDAEAVATAMQRFLNNPQLAAQMGEASIRFVEEYYDVRKVNRTIMDTMELT